MAKEKKKKTTMTYVVYYLDMVGSKVLSRTKQATYKTEEEAIDHVEKYNKRKKRKNTATYVPIPKNVQVGTELLWKGRSGEGDWQPYGVIVKVLDHFYIVCRHWKNDENDEAFYLKDSFNDKIANEIFKVVIEE